jgi:hypothetical protein
MNLIQSMKDEAYEIILGGDFNEKNNDDVIRDIKYKMNMKEILRGFKNQDISAYIRRSTQIDKIFFTKTC